MNDLSWLKKISPGAANLAKGGQVSPGATRLFDMIKQSQQTPVQVPFAPGTPVRPQEEQPMSARPTPHTAADSGMLGPEAGQITRGFHIDDFRCKGTGEANVSADLVNRLQQLEDYLGVPITVTSGYRSPEHNRRVSGVEGSLHTKGIAADIQARGVSMNVLARAAKKFFPTAVVYRNHVHVDLGPARSW